MKQLFILANAFPYGTWEPFLKTEVEYQRNYDRVTIFSLSVRGEQRRTVRQIDNPRVQYFPIAFQPEYIYLLNAVTVLVNPRLWSELVSLFRKRQATVQRIISVFVFFSRAHYEYRQIKKIIQRKQLVRPGDEVLIYGYRFLYQPYLGWLLQKFIPMSRIVARAHGADLYEEISPTKYLPMREFSLKILDRLYFVSQFGMDYLVNKFPDFQHKFALSLLGTHDHGVQSFQHDANTFRIVTCSSLTPVKRIDRLIDALAVLETHGRDVEWVHYGEGVLGDALKTAAQTKLAGKVSVTFAGHIDNEQLIAEYLRSQTDLFMNVSESEGIPVSIMEALSLGIPVVATAVGGNTEIVSNDNGRIMPANPSPQQIAKSIEELILLPENAYLALRERARVSWQEKFWAKMNYQKFTQELADLLDRQ